MSTLSENTRDRARANYKTMRTLSHRLPLLFFRFFRLHFRLEFGHHRRGVVVVRIASFGEMERDRRVRESGKASESARGTRSIVVKRRRMKGEDDDDDDF